MNGDVWGALVVFLLIVLGALGTIVRYVPGWVERLGKGYLDLWETKIQAQITLLKKDLAANTEITNETHQLSNGRLHEALKRAEDAETAQRELRDLVRYLETHEQVVPLVQAFHDRRKRS